MDDSVFPPNAMFSNPSESIMDFDYMDELLLDGCWLQATDGSEFLNNSPSTTNPLFDPSFLWPTLESNNGDPLPKEVQEERQRSSFPENLSVSIPEEENSSKSLINSSIGLPYQSQTFLSGGSEISRRWWIAPRANAGPSLSVMERLIRAIENVKLNTVNKNVLVQVWLPENREGKKVLSTNHQLYSLDLNCPRLSNYRYISQNYHFPAEGDSKENVGLPGRVYMGKVPEWTPDVRLFKAEEYPRVVHAKQYDVRGSVAVPVFSQDSRTCLGVIEVVMTTQKSNYSPEIQSVCEALEAVDLRSSESSNTQKIEASDCTYQVALPEIREILKSACETHNLPLAQTWIPCIQQGKGGCRHSDENVIRCISTVDSACYVSDARFKDFQEACSEHHLLKGQGVVGRAFNTNQPCYSSDITLYTKTQYPLSHHAKIFDLHGAVAIRLRSTFTGTTDYVLEFFLPVDCKDQEEQKRMLNSLSIIIQKVCRSLRIVTEKELQDEAIVLPVNGELLVLSDRVVPEVEEAAYLGTASQEVSTEKSLDLMSKQQNDSGSGEGSFANTGKKGERRRAKTEKTITLQMLRQHFAGSLKDAAKNIGVCPTTLKRICRQHGIQRWPSRKIKKVGHSLQKIQLVMDSVQGASGSFQIESFYANFPELASSDLSKASPLSASKGIEGATAATTKSQSPSCSQSSSSGQSCSSGTHAYPQTPTGENTANPVLKRTRSDAELHASNDQEPVILPRSFSHKDLSELPKTLSLPPKPQITGRNSQERSLQRVKVTFGEEKVRFRMQKDWGYRDLLQEIAKRFSVNDINGFHLKYFDDDSEWVLLTCDADLEECIDVCRSSKSSTIKLSLREPQHRVGSSVGSNAPL